MDDVLRIGLIDRLLLRRTAMTLVLRHEQIGVEAFETAAACVQGVTQAQVLVYLPLLSNSFAVLENLATLCQTNLPVVVVADSDAAREFLRRGAKGFIHSQSSDIPKAIAAIRFVRDGGVYAPFETVADPAPPPVVLTPRQREVLEKLRVGMPTKLIAFELGMSESTAKVHIRLIMKRLGTTNRTETVYRSHLLGLAA